MIKIILQLLLFETSLNRYAVKYAIQVIKNPRTIKNSPHKKMIKNMNRPNDKDANIVSNSQMAI
jgi:hypothetical protein